MKIGVCVTFASAEEFRKKIDELIKEGFDNCQIISWEPEVWTNEHAVFIKNLLEEKGITASAFWCGWGGPKIWDYYDGPLTLGLVPPEYREMRVKNLCDGADFAKTIGITCVVTHMGFIPENPNDPQFRPFCDAVKTVADHLHANGQYLLFETGQETPTAMLRCFEEVRADNLGVNYDTANLIAYGKANPVDGLDVIGKYVMGVHAKDAFYPTSGKTLGEEVPIGTGKVDFEAVLNGLHAIGYDGCITIEREIEGEQQTRDIRMAKVYLQDLIDRICKLQ